MKFKKRECAPVKGDVHYYKDNIFYRCGFCLPNCTCYAWGRFYELLEELGIEGSPKLQTSNAENWYEDEHIYEKGKVPRLGAVVVWKQGKYHFSIDGAGHVGIVEEIREDGSILVSQSGYNSKREFYLTEHNNRYEKSGYQFEGFIYLPKEFDDEKTEASSDDFKVGDKVLVMSGYATQDSYGNGSRTALYHGIPEDGDVKYITDITDLNRPRPYHLSNEPENTHPRGWVSKGQIKKI